MSAPKLQGIHFAQFLFTTDIIIFLGKDMLSVIASYFDGMPTQPRYSNACRYPIMALSVNFLTETIPPSIDVKICASNYKKFPYILSIADGKPIGFREEKERDCKVILRQQKTFEAFCLQCILRRTIASFSSGLKQGNGYSYGHSHLVPICCSCLERWHEEGERAYDMGIVWKSGWRDEYRRKIYTLNNLKMKKQTIEKTKQRIQDGKWLFCNSCQEHHSHSSFSKKEQRKDLPRCRFSYRQQH